MRGSQQLNLFVITPKDSPVLSNVDRRNELMACRYYYYYIFFGYRYERCLKELGNEFFLAEATMIDILTKMQPRILELKNKQTTCWQLAIMYPHLMWKAAA